MFAKGIHMLAPAPALRSHPLLNYRTLQTGLLIVTLALTAISLVPSLSAGASISLKSLVLIASGAALLKNWSRGDKVQLLSRCSQIVSLLLGICSIALKMPRLYTAALSINVAAALVDSAHGIYEGDKIKSAFHLTMLLVSILALSAMCTGSWRALVAASVIGGSAIFAMGFVTVIVRSDPNSPEKHYDIIDGTLYMILGFLLAVGSTIRAAEITGKRPVRSHFLFKNEYDSPMKVYGTTKQLLATLQKGESLALSLPMSECAYFPGGSYSWPTSCVYVQYPELGNLGSWYYPYDAIRIDHVPHTLKAPLAHLDFPKLPTANDVALI